MSLQPAAAARSGASATGDTFAQCGGPAGRVLAVPNPQRAIVMSGPCGPLPLQPDNSGTKGHLYMVDLRERQGKRDADIHVFTRSGFDDDVHSAVMCAYSSYVSDVVRQVPPPLNLDLTPMRLHDGALAQCIQFAYKNEVTIELSTCGALLLAASALGMDNMRRLVSAYMRAEALLPQCAARLYEMAFGGGDERLARCMDEELAGGIERRMCDAFPALARTEALAVLSPPAMCALLGKDAAALGSPPPPNDQLYLVEAAADWLLRKCLMQDAAVMRRVCDALDPHSWSPPQLDAVLGHLRSEPGLEPLLLAVTGKEEPSELTAVSISDQSRHP